MPTHRIPEMTDVSLAATGHRRVTFVMAPAVTQVFAVNVNQLPAQSRRAFHSLSPFSDSGRRANRNDDMPKRRAPSDTSRCSGSCDCPTAVPSTYSPFLPPALQPKEHLEILYRQNPWAAPRLQQTSPDEGRLGSSRTPNRSRVASRSDSSSASSNSTNASRASISSTDAWSSSARCSLTNAERASSIVEAFGGREAFARAVSDLYNIEPRTEAR